MTLSKRDDDNGANAYANNTFSPHVMVQADKLHAKGITGKGIKIAVIDTGVSFDDNHPYIGDISTRNHIFFTETKALFQVDFKHPDLGGCFGKGCHISFGYDLVGDAYDGTNTPVPDDEPNDCDSHGTHVTGIITAKPNALGFSGIAPGATTGHYRVLGCAGGASTDVLIDATNMAVKAGVNVISISLGVDGGWNNDPWGNMLSRVVKKGITVVVAGGNSGYRGAFAPTKTSNGEGVLAIGSFDSTHLDILASTSHYSIDGGEKAKFGYAAGNPDDWEKATLPLWAGNFDLSKPDDACQPYPDDTPNLSGFIVLIRRGTCLFNEKGANAVAKGARYIMFYNNVEGIVPIGGIDGRELRGTGMTTAEFGETWVKALKAGKKVVLQMTAPKHAEKLLITNKNSLTGGAPSSFTSWGATLDMHTKPQFSGPGGNILSTLPVSRGSYGVYSGTSMATPMIAGVIALIQEARGHLKPAEIANLLSSTAKPTVFNDGTQWFNYLAPVAQQGSGLVQAAKAAYATTLISPTSLAFNDTEHINQKLTFTIHNMAKKRVTYEIGNSPAAGIYFLQDGGLYPDKFPNDRVLSAATLKFTRNNMTLSPGAKATIGVQITIPKDMDPIRLPLYSGWITINGTDGSSLILPYEGLAGNFRNETTLLESFTWLANSTLGPGEPVSPGEEFVIPKPGTATPDDSLPTGYFVPLLGSTIITVDAVSVVGSSLNLVGPVMGSPIRYLNRHYLGGVFWDGQLSNGSYVPAGKYIFRVSALRIFGDVKNKDDWDIHNTYDFTIKYKEQLAYQIYKFGYIQCGGPNLCMEAQASYKTILIQTL